MSIIDSKQYPIQVKNCGIRLKPVRYNDYVVVNCDESPDNISSGEESLPLAERRKRKRNQNEFACSPKRTGRNKGKVDYTSRDDSSVSSNSSYIEEQDLPEFSVSSSSSDEEDPNVDSPQSSFKKQRIIRKITKEQIWSKFLNLFHLSKASRTFHFHDSFTTRFSNPLLGIFGPDPYHATDQDVYDFIAYIDLTERLDTNYFKEIISSINFYRKGSNQLVYKEVSKHVKNSSSRFHGPWIQDPKKVKSLPSLFNVPHKSRSYFTEFKKFCKKSQPIIDPFQASSVTVFEFMKMIFQTMSDNYSSLLKPHLYFYQENIKSILTNLSFFMENPMTIEDGTRTGLKKMTEAGKACDEKFISNSFAISLLPSHNYTRTLVNMELSKEGYWDTRFMRKVFHDLKKEKLVLHVAARDLGVTPEMLFNAMCKYYMVFDEKKIKVLALSEFVENKCGSELQYWKEPKIQKLLTEVRHRRVPIEVLAFKIGVSRNEVDLKCGGVKTLKDIEAEEELDRIERIRKQEEAAENRIKTTHLDRQIMYAEDHEEDLCAYEKQRLANLRERKALMEMLDITGDKLEIRKLNRIIQKPGSKEGKEAGIEEKPLARQKSTRIRKQEEIKRLKSSEEALLKSHRWSRNDINVSNEQRQDYGSSLTPWWFGKRFSGKTHRQGEISEINRVNVLPRIEILTKEILEITDDYRKTKILLDSISAESKGMVEENECYKADVNWAAFTDIREHLVSSSPITRIDTYGDFVTYGTENGAVGVLIAGHSLNLRPHTDMVSGLIMDGPRIVSSSLDGTVRNVDLESGIVPLEYSWDMIGDSKHGVLGMTRRSEHSLFLDCDEKLVILDQRQKDPASVGDLEGVNDSYPYVDLRPSTISMEPMNSNLFSICRDSNVTIRDVRNINKTVWTLNSNNLTFAGWNSTAEEFTVCFNDKYWLFDVSEGIPKKDKRFEFKTSYHLPKDVDKGDFSLDGSLWCPWQSSVLFFIGKKKLYQMRSTSATFLSALNSKR